MEFLSSLLPASLLPLHLHSSSVQECEFLLPLSAVSAFPSLFSKLAEMALSSSVLDECGIASWSVSLTSLEEVFLNLASQEEQQEEKEKEIEKEKAKMTNETKASELHPSKTPQNQEDQPNKAVSASSSPASFSDFISHASLPHPVPFLRQFSAIAMKRLLHSRRDFQAFYIQFVFPLIYVFLLLLVYRVTFPSPTYDRHPLLMAALSSAFASGPANILIAGTLHFVSLCFLFLFVRHFSILSDRFCFSVVFLRLFFWYLFYRFRDSLLFCSLSWSELFFEFPYSVLGTNKISVGGLPADSSLALHCESAFIGSSCFLFSAMGWRERKRKEKCMRE